MHSLACVPNDTLKVRVEGNPPREPAHAPEISWKHSAERLIGDLLSASLSWKQSAECFRVTCSRHLYSSAQKESRYCCQDEDQVPKGLYMGDHVYFSRHSSAVKGIFWHSNHQFIMTVAPQARHKKHAPAGPGTTQVTATQWLIFLFSRFAWEIIGKPHASAHSPTDPSNDFAV